MRFHEVPTRTTGQRGARTFCWTQFLEPFLYQLSYRYGSGSPCRLALLTSCWTVRFWRWAKTQASPHEDGSPWKPILVKPHSGYWFGTKAVEDFSLIPQLLLSWYEFLVSTTWKTKLPSSIKTLTVKTNKVFVPRVRLLHLSTMLTKQLIDANEQICSYDQPSYFTKVGWPHQGHEAKELHNLHQRCGKPTGGLWSKWPHHHWCTVHKREIFAQEGHYRYRYW